MTERQLLLIKIEAKIKEIMDSKALSDDDKMRIIKKAKKLLGGHY